MRRKVTVCILIIICFILQCTLFKSWAFASISPNLMIVIAASFGFMRGKKEGLIVGFLCGMFIDIFYGDVFGFYGLVYMYIGYLNGFFRKIFYPEDIKLPMILITISDFSCSLIVYLFLFLFRGRLDFPYYFMNVIIPQLVYTILVTIILYQAILRINRWLEAYEKRSASKFV